jgi:D-3-phosphoglycerate dehydrogenase
VPKNGDIAGAALDVYENEPPNDSPLLELDNIVFTPHFYSMFWQPF